MADINKTVQKYLELRSLKTKLETELFQVEQEIAKYCKENKKKILSFENQNLLITQKTKTVFPSLSNPQRKELEKILKENAASSQYKTIDITRLASAYDSNKMPADLKAALKPLATSKDYVRISILPGVSH
jgi:hypothetical protein